MSETKTQVQNLAKKITSDMIAKTVKPYNSSSRERLERETDLEILVTQYDPNDLDNTIVFKHGNQEITMKRLASFYINEDTVPNKHEASGMEIISYMEGAKRKLVHDVISKKGLPISFKIIEREVFVGATPNFIKALKNDKEITLEAYKHHEINVEDEEFPMIVHRKKSKSAADYTNWGFVPVTMVQLTY